MSTIAPEEIIAMMKPGQLYKPAILAGHFNIGTAAMKVVLQEMEAALKLQSVMNLGLRHWQLPVARVEVRSEQPVERSGRSNMPDYSRVRERLEQDGAIKSKFD